MNKNKLINTLLITTTFLGFVPLQAVFAASNDVIKFRSEASNCENFINSLDQYFLQTLSTLTSIQAAFSSQPKTFLDELGQYQLQVESGANPTLSVSKPRVFPLETQEAADNEATLTKFFQDAIDHALSSNTTEGQMEDIKQCVQMWIQKQFPQLLEHATDAGSQKRTKQIEDLRSRLDNIPKLLADIAPKLLEKEGRDLIEKQMKKL